MLTKIFAGILLTFVTLFGVQSYRLAQTETKLESTIGELSTLAVEHNNSIQNFETEIGTLTATADGVIADLGQTISDKDNIIAGMQTNIQQYQQDIIKQKKDKETLSNELTEVLNANTEDACIAERMPPSITDWVHELTQDSL